MPASLRTPSLSPSAPPKTSKPSTAASSRVAIGVAEVENENHCDFKKLRPCLSACTCSTSFCLITEESHYENYRQQQMEARKFGEPTVKKSDNPKFKEEEEQLRKHFTEQVKAEESRFRQWELRLIAERDRLNKDLELVHSAIKQLEAELDNLDNLQAAMAAVPTGSEQVSVYLRGKALKPLNIEIMKRLGTRVNLVPVVTQNDLFTFKQHVREVVAAQGIRIYAPPIEADDESADNTCILSDTIPFSIIGPTEGVKALDGRVVEG